MCAAMESKAPAVRPVDAAFEVAVHAWLEANRLSATPWPACVDCGYPFCAGDAGDFEPDVCASCETARLEALVAGLISPSWRSRHAARRQLKRLRRLAR